MFSSDEKAFFAPFAAFLAFLALNQFIAGLFDGMRAAWWFSEPHFWIFPLQTFVCGAMMVRWWPRYGFQLPTRPVFTIGVGICVLLIWLAPQLWFGFPPRMKGFDPTYFHDSPVGYWVTVILRFVRLAVVVPLLEEIFWRGYLLRVLIAQPFSSVPVGTFTWRSFGFVTLGFCLEHQPADWPAAIAAGMLYNAVAYRTHSLSACVLAHSVTNLLLGFFVMRTGQWGFW